jgi:hypothetical protein
VPTAVASQDRRPICLPVRRAGPLRALIRWFGEMADEFDDALAIEWDDASVPGAPPSVCRPPRWAASAEE